VAFLFEWQVRAPQATLLELMQCCWWEQGCSAEILDGPQDDEGVAWLNAPADGRRYAPGTVEKS